FKRFLAASADRNVDAFFGERVGNTFADTFAATGDQRGLTLELEVHRFLPVLFWRFVSKPSAGFRRGEKLGQGCIEGARLFRGNIVTAARNHQQPGGRHDALEKNTAIDAGLVFIANNDKERY